MGHVTKPSGRTVLTTPGYFVQRCADMLGIERFDLDAAALSWNKQADAYFGPDHEDVECIDALIVEDWSAYGDYVWLNPPYGRGLTGKWAEYAKEQALHNHCVVCGLFPGDSRGSQWWHSHVVPGASDVWDVEGRISFLDEEGIPQKGNQFNSVVIIWDNTRPTYPKLCSIGAKE